MFFGTCIHETIQKMIQEYYYNKLTELKFYVAHFKSLLKLETKKALNDLPKCINRLEYTEAFKDSIPMLKFIYNNISRIFDRNKLLLVPIENSQEYNVQTNIKKDSVINFNGHLDILVKARTSNTYIIWDIKTSYGTWKNKINDRLTANQLKLYKIYFAKKLNVPLDSIIIAYLVLKRKPGEDNKYVELYKLDPDMKDLKMTIQDFVSFVDTEYDHNTGEFLEKNSHMIQDSDENCKYCEFNYKKEDGTYFCGKTG